MVPFTGSHPAAVLPLLRSGIPASALVIGSMAPDLPYFLPSPVTPAETHSLVGVFGANLLLGLGAFLVWHLWLVPPLLWASPEQVQRRIPDRLRGGRAVRLGSARDLALLVTGLILGALTHVVWDSFTHAGMWGTTNLTWLSTPVLGLALSRWLQHVSTVVGLAAVGWFLMRWWRTADQDGSTAPIGTTLRTGLAAILLGIPAGITLLLVGIAFFVGHITGQSLVIIAVIYFVKTLGLGLLIAAAVWHLVVGRIASRQAAEASVTHA